MNSIIYYNNDKITAVSKFKTQQAVSTSQQQCVLTSIHAAVYIVHSEGPEAHTHIYVYISTPEPKLSSCSAHTIIIRACFSSRYSKRASRVWYTYIAISLYVYIRHLYSREREPGAFKARRTRLSLLLSISFRCSSSSSIAENARKLLANKCICTYASCIYV